MNNIKVGIIGNGWVGKGMQDLFPEAITYVRNKDHKHDLNHFYTTNKEVISSCEIVFICVPTPNVNNKALDTSAVEECIKWCNAPLLVVRSTVNPGDCDGWTRKYNKNIIMQPEYLGETPAHPLLDTKLTNFLILGGDKIWTRRLIELYQTVYNANTKIRQVTKKEAEIIKLTENRAIAFKVAQCQELYDVCKLEGVDYYEVAQAVYGDDPRFNLWWTFVFPEKRGFNSKCIPKDIYAWCAWAESLGYRPHITNMILSKNKEWIEQNEI